jgi:hypothetical protein
MPRKLPVDLLLARFARITDDQAAPLWQVRYHYQAKAITSPRRGTWPIKRVAACATHVR